jgi:hypothetical protein
VGQEPGEEAPRIPRADLERAIHLVLPDGTIRRGAEAVYVLFARYAGRPAQLWAWRHLPGFAWASRIAYAAIARHRGAADRIERALWGGEIGPQSFALSRWLFLRLVALVYLAAFLSLWPQILGLIGERGLEPASELLDLLRERMGPERFAYVPSLAWLGSSDLALRAMCAAGALIAGLLLVDLAPAWCALALYVLYLSIVSVGGDFLSFQWDSLLLEVGLLAVLYAPWRLARAAPRREPTRIGRWLLWWLAFRLMFASGAVKLASGDAAWRSLSALAYHYQTQPLPTPIAWYAHHLPPWFHAASVAAMFAVEIGAAFLVFLPRRLRHLACVLFVLFQVLIAATGNYGMFNLVSVALFATLLDDAFLLRLVPARLRPTLGTAPRPREASSKLLLAAPLAVLVVMVSGVQTFDLLRRAWGRAPLGGIARTVVDAVAPLRSVNRYGLFAVMTTERPEIEIEGERDDGTWVAYRFRWKVGPLDRPPPWVAPHMPRLDWQMWFAALGGARQERWFRTLLQRLLKGEPSVLGLLESSPFPGGPPRRVRARLYLYEFTTPAERALSGDWWKREWVRDVVPPVALGG